MSDDSVYVILERSIISERDAIFTFEKQNPEIEEKDDRIIDVLDERNKVVGTIRLQDDGSHAMCISEKSRYGDTVKRSYQLLGTEGHRISLIISK